ncbi:MAG: hypothetical protein PHU85_15675 [Phycisphaerae bacterium]|nr:hypothetical protein [Phycisphaerae bacterium]
MGIEPKSRARLAWPQSQDVPLGGAYLAFGDDRTGTVDYTVALAGPIDAWPNGEGKSGWGIGGWGDGLWGHDEGALGWADGAWGMGAWGVGAEMLYAVTPLLADGLHTLALVSRDAAGNPAVPSGGKEAEVALAGTPRPPAALRAGEYDAGEDALTLIFALSPDDEG